MSVDLRQISFIPSWVIVSHQLAKRGKAAHYGHLGSYLDTVMITPTPGMMYTFPELEGVEAIWLAFKHHSD